jgi:hypothetical protein
MDTNHDSLTERSIMWHIKASCGLIALAIVAAGCAARETTTIRRETTVRTVPAAPVVVETTTTETRAQMVDISIIDLHGEPAPDPSMERVVGTIINEGDRAVSRLSIRVDALDSAGNVVNSITTPPLTETIDSRGGRATFEASMPRNPAVTAYHAVAIAR